MTRLQIFGCFWFAITAGLLLARFFMLFTHARVEAEIVRHDSNRIRERGGFIQGITFQPFALLSYEYLGTPYTGRYIGRISRRKHPTGSYLYVLISKKNPEKIYHRHNRYLFMPAVMFGIFGVVFFLAGTYLV